MARVALAGGHSKKAPGASGYINEYTEDRKVNKALIAEMKKRGHTTYDCSNESSTVNSELAKEVSKANSSKAKIFCATHFNAFKTTSSKRGVEVWYYSGDATGKKVAKAMSAALAKELGLPDRGAKATKDLYVIAYTNMTAVLAEVCFVDAKGDTNAYKAEKLTNIAVAMADALELATGKGSGTASKPSSSASNSKPSSSLKDLGKVNVDYALNLYGGSWWPWVRNWQNKDSDGYAGCPYKKHDGFKAKVTKGSIQYRCQDATTGKWTSWKKDGASCMVPKYISQIETKYITPDGYVVQHSWSQAQTVERAGWLPTVCCNGKCVKGYTDTAAGWDGEALDRFRLSIGTKNPY